MKRLQLSILSLAFALSACGVDTPATRVDVEVDVGAPDVNAQDAALDTSDAAPTDTLESDRDVDQGDLGQDVDTTDARDDTPPDLRLGTPSRPVEAQLPRDYDPSLQYPLVLLLHGYGMTPLGVESLLSTQQTVDDRGLILVTPTGELDPTGQRFWNATNYCCDYYASDVDDARYLMDVIDQAAARFSVDEARIAVVGFSAGGFMAHRLACDFPDRIAAIASISGSSFNRPEACAATDGGPSVLHVHGTADTVVSYYGSLAYPSANTVAARWADRNRCDAAPQDAGRADFDWSIPGGETAKREWRGCFEDRRVAIWSLQPGLHFPSLRAQFVQAALDFLLD